MIECDRLHAKISVHQCIVNWNRSQRKGMVSAWGSGENDSIVAVSCPDCEEGAWVREMADKCECGRWKAAGEPHCGSEACALKAESKTKRTGGVCKHCGKQFEPFKNGRVTVRSTCRECFGRTRRDTLRLAQETRQWISTLAAQERALVEFLQQDLNLLEALRSEAEREFRPLSYQVLMILRRAVEAV